MTKRQPAPHPSLSQTTARGFAWMFGQNIAAKVASTLGQIVIAYFLIAEDFGVAMIAWTLSIPATLIQQGGLKEVLIQRHRRFSLWGNAAFWMSLVLGLSGALIMVAAAPLAARWYNDDRLFQLLLIVALLFPLESLSVVPLARIHSQLRFRLVASLALMTALLQTGLSIVFAVSKFGPYSLVLPRPIIALVTVLVCWSVARPSLRMNLQLRRWRYLVGDGMRAMGAYACDLGVIWGGYLILSIIHGAGAVGFYYFAFNLSLQSIVLITMSLGGVLFPTLSQLQDEPHRQAAAFLRAVRVLACLAVPACLLQAAVADPGMRLLFRDYWNPAIPLVQVLSVGMALRAIGRPAMSLMQAQGRFSTQFMLALASLIVFAALGTLGAWMYGEMGVAVALSIHMLLTEPLNLYFAIRAGGKGWKDLIRALTAPIALAVLSIGPAALAGIIIPDFRGANVVRCLAIGTIAVALFIPLFRLLAPDAWREAMHRGRRVLGWSASEVTVPTFS